MNECVSLQSADRPTPMGTLPQREQASAPAEGVVVVLGKDLSSRRSIESSMQDLPSVQIKAFESIEDFFSHPAPVAAWCLVLELEVDGVNGFDVQRRLACDGNPVPVIFFTSRDDASTAVRALKAGASDYLVKPASTSALVAAISEALSRDNARRRAMRDAAPLLRRLESLTPREREVMDLIAAGKLNKQVAFDLGISELTVKVHRSRIMKKMGASTAVDLVRRVDRSVRDDGAWSEARSHSDDRDDRCMVSVEVDGLALRTR